jgi:hypothetical protein
MSAVYSNAVDAAESKKTVIPSDTLSSQVYALYVRLRIGLEVACSPTPCDIRSRMKRA